MVMTSSIIPRSSTSGTKPAPMPWMSCAPGRPPESTALSSGSTAIIASPGRRDLSAWAQPVRVPPVPTLEMITSTRPWVSRQISSAVVRRWMAGLAGFSNCCSMIASPSSATSAAAREIDPSIPRAAGVSSISAPSRRRSLRRSSDMLSGMVRIRR